jgi:hypothetical protein
MLIVLRRLLLSAFGDGFTDLYGLAYGSYAAIYLAPHLLSFGF